MSASMDEITKVPSNKSSLLNQGEFGYPLGHLGHLTPAQQSALDDFRKLVAEKGLYTPATDDKPATHTDPVLLRFLRARRFVPADALKQFKDTEDWRSVNDIDTLYRNIDVDNYDDARRLYPQWTGRRDKRGIPVYLFEVKPLNSKTMAAYATASANTKVINTKNPILQGNNAGGAESSSSGKTKSAAVTPPRLLRLFALYENLTNFMLELCTSLHDRPHSDTPITQSNNIVDISGVGLKQFWNLRSHMQDASMLATAHYPETLDRIFIVGAPSFFPTVWSWIKRWFDPITVSKIFILSEKDVYSTLSSFIDPESIPKKFGGTLDYKFGDLPPVDPAYADYIEWQDGEGNSKDRKWPRGPLLWNEVKEDGSRDVVAVGSVDGRERREVVATLRLDKLQAAAERETAATTTATATTTTTTDKAPEQVVLADSEKTKENQKPNDPSPASLPQLEKSIEPVPLAAVATKLPGDLDAGGQKTELPMANGQA